MKRILYFIILLIFMVSCSKNDTLMSEKELMASEQKQSFLIGKWKLLKVVNSFSTKSTYYEYKGITFTFKNNGKVFVSSDNKAFLKGEYSYKLTSESITADKKNEVKMIVIEGVKFTYKYDKKILELSNAHVDGVILYLRK